MNKNELQGIIESNITSKMGVNSITPTILGETLSGMTELTGSVYVEGGANIGVSGTGVENDPFIVEYIGVTPESPTIFKTKVTLTSEQVKNLGTTPVDAIPAQGVGVDINLISVVVILKAGTTPFDDTHTLTIKHSGYNEVLFGRAFVFSGGILGETSNSKEVLKASSQILPLVMNTKVIITSEVDSVATGDGTVDVFLTYEKNNVTI